MNIDRRELILSEVEPFSELEIEITKLLSNNHPRSREMTWRYNLNIEQFQLYWYRRRIETSNNWEAYQKLFSR